MGQQPPDTPQPPPPATPQPPATIYVERRGNGLAVAALVLGIVGAVFGLISLTPFIYPGVCGVLAVVFGIVGMRKAKGAPHKGMALAGFILGVLVIGLGVWGVAHAATTSTRF
jgi:hypothetical protein